jgi:prolyl-tRNA synthetase
MRQSQLFPKTIKQAPKDAESINHKLLVRGGFIDQLMAGSWTLLPMGWKVVDKINDIIRDELNKTGAQEMLMPLLHPKDIWNETGRWEKAKEVMYQFKDARGKEYALSFTHEEIILDLVRKHLDSYQDLPIALYHFSTKFRNEPRARSGILRGREFLMKDLYSVHATESDFWRYYNEVKEAYKKIFKRLGFDIKVTEAGGGVFTDNVTHEFQVPTEGGEDLIYFCSECDWGMNQEIFEGKEGDACPRCGGIIKKSKSIEVGNIFPFGTSYSEKMDVTFTDENGKRKPVWFGSYGIGSTRVMGAWVEVSHDEKGMIWNDKMAPFDLHLLDIKKDDKGGGEAAYNMLKEEGLDVLFDERDVSAGVKFTDADLIGIPIRLVISDKTGEKLEYKKRNEDKSKLFNKEELLKSLTN